MFFTSTRAHPRVLGAMDGVALSGLLATVEGNFIHPQGIARMFDYPFHARSKFSPSDALPVVNHLGHRVGVATSAKRACELLANHGLANARTCMRKVSGTTVFADVRCTDKPMMFVY